jgi:hypothetical protein
MIGRAHKLRRRVRDCNTLILGVLGGAPRTHAAHQEAKSEDQERTGRAPATS